MKKYEILYDWPIVEINRLADSAEAEAYANGLAGPALDSFTELTEKLRGIGVDLVAAKAARQLLANWQLLKQYVERFEREFGTFPAFVGRKFRLSIVLAEVLSQAAPALDAADVDPNVFEIRPLLSAVPPVWFCRENAASFADSLVVFACQDSALLEREITRAVVPISPLIIFHLLAVLHAMPDVPLVHVALVKKSQPPIDDAAVDAFARLLIIGSGGVVYPLRDYAGGGLSIIDRDEMRAGIPYHQWNDVFHVLSEYNGRQELLTKFLTLYHVFENLMVKFPIVQLERQHGGRMFSIRDFRRLFRQVDESEMASLKRLFQVVFQMTVRPGTTFESHIVTRWNGLVPGIVATDIENAMGALEIRKDKRPLRHAEFAVGEPASYMAQMVYAFRNAIVHNKETEFHLTYASLDATLRSLLETFLIPTLEEMCFALIGRPNSHVWYQNKEIVLYQ